MSTAQADKRLADRFGKHGFTVIEDLFPLAQLNELKSTMDALIRDYDFEQYRSVFTTTDRDRGRDQFFLDSAQNVSCFLEQEAVDNRGQLTVEPHRAVNKVGHALHDHLPAFGQFCRSPLIASVLRSLGIPRARLWQTMYIFKQPRIGGEVLWHQDASYLRTHPASVVGLWVAMEDANRDNGCLWMSPGAHLSPLREAYRVDWTTRTGQLEVLDATPWPSDEEAIPIEVPAGSLVVFDDHMPHYSSPNRSERSRQAFTMHFAPESAEWSPENWLQRDRLPPFTV